MEGSIWSARIIRPSPVSAALSAALMVSKLRTAGPSLRPVIAAKRKSFAGSVVTSSSCPAPTVAAASDSRPETE